MGIRVYNIEYIRMQAIKRIALGPKAAPQNIMATLIDIHYGPVGEFAEINSTLIRTFKELPVDGAMWLMPADYVLPHVYRTVSVVRYYTSRDTWIENGIEFQERPYALTT